MATISEFLGMGGYARFVWPSYGVTAVVMIAILVASRHRLRGNEAAHRKLKAPNRKNDQENNRENDRDATVEKKT